MDAEGQRKGFPAKVLLEDRQDRSGELDNFLRTDKDFHLLR